MRFIFKTSYEQDIRLAKHGGHVFWYGLLLLGLLAAGLGARRLRRAGWRAAGGRSGAREGGCY